eukprot:UN17222
MKQTLLDLQPTLNGKIFSINRDLRKRLNVVERQLESMRETVEDIPDHLTESHISRKELSVNINKQQEYPKPVFEKSDKF